MDRSRVVMDLFLSEKWIRFLESSAAALQINLVFSDEAEELFSAYSKCPCCGNELPTGPGDYLIRRIFRYDDKYLVTARDFTCCHGNGILSFEEKAGIAGELLTEFCSILIEQLCGGNDAVELYALHRVGCMVLSAFRNDENAVERVLDLNLSAANFLLNAYGSWIDCSYKGQWRLLTKAIRQPSPEYDTLIIRSTVAVALHSPVVAGTIGIIATDGSAAADEYLDDIAHECVTAFEIIELLRLMESRLTMILNAVDSPVLLVERNKKICFASNAAVKLLRRPLSELIGVPVTEIDTPWRQGFFSETGEVSKSTKDLLLSGNEERLVDWEIIPLTSGHDIAGWVVTVRDCTDYYQLQELKERTDNLVSASVLLRVIAHEIRNPLTTFKGLLQIIDLKSRTPEISKYVGIGMNEIIKISIMLDEFSQSGRVSELSFEKTEMKAFMQEIYNLAVTGFSGPDIEITASFNAAPPVMVDKRQLTQAIFNLVKNAYEALNRQGIISLSLREHNKDWVEISVCDNGPGIPDRVKDKLFKLYYSTKADSIGLGLAIVKSIVENHNGKISVCNNPGGGACFSVLLPICSP